MIYERIHEYFVHVFHAAECVRTRPFHHMISSLAMNTHVRNTTPQHKVAGYKRERVKSTGLSSPARSTTSTAGARGNAIAFIPSPTVTRWNKVRFFQYLFSEECRAIPTPCVRFAGMCRCRSSQVLGKRRKIENETERKAVQTLGVFRRSAIVQTTDYRCES